MIIQNLHPEFLSHFWKQQERLSDNAGYHWTTHLNTISSMAKKDTCTSRFSNTPEILKNPAHIKLENLISTSSTHTRTSCFATDKTCIILVPDKLINGNDVCITFLQEKDWKHHSLQLNWELELHPMNKNKIKSKERLQKSATSGFRKLEADAVRK